MRCWVRPGLSSRLSHPLTDENEGAGCKITEQSLANLDGMDSSEQGALEVENLEEELNSGDVSPLLSVEGHTVECRVNKTRI